MLKDFDNFNEEESTNESKELSESPRLTPPDDKGYVHLALVDEDGKEFYPLSFKPESLGKKNTDMVKKFIVKLNKTLITNGIQ